MFPQSIGMGATWDTQLARQAGQATRDQVCSAGTVWDFAPVQDPARDNRWGRYYETWGEEPALSGAIGGANIKGLQSGTCPTEPGLRVASTVKHFAGYSESINGHDRVEEQIPIRYLQDLFLPSYAEGINAGADTVMVNSGSINGIPATASHFLLTTELRQRLGFKGVVISDYGDIPALQTTYHIAPDLATAAAEAINAGVDMAMEPFDSTSWNAAVMSDVENGSIPMWRINQAVTTDPDAEVQARSLRAPLRRPQQGRCRHQRPFAPGAKGRRRVDDAAAQPERRAAALDDQPCHGRRPERGLDP